MREIPKAVQSIFDRVVLQLNSILNSISKFRHKQTINICNNVDEPQKLCSKCKKPNKEAYILYDSIYMTFKKILLGQKLYLVARGWNRCKKLITKGHKGTFWGDGNIVCLDRGGGYKAIYICQNSSNCKPKTEFYCINYTSISLT